MSRYAHVIARVFDSAWAVRPETLAIIVDVIRMRAAGERFTEAELAERIGAAPTRRGTPARAGAVAVIPLQGVILYRAGMMEQLSGAVSLATFMEQFRAAMADEEIGSIVLDIDSPGGEVSGIPEAAAEIRAARDTKRIVAVANPTAASGAYWLGAQASEFQVIPSGWVGSIGVYTAHDDLSKMFEMEGISETLISAGKYKVEGNPLEPLSDEARAYRQTIVDDYYSMFVADVAKGRGVSPADVRNGMGQGRMVLAKGAKAERMVDGIGTLDDAIRKALGTAKPAAAAHLVIDPATLAPPSAVDSEQAGPGAVPTEPPPVPDPEPEPPGEDDPAADTAPTEEPHAGGDGLELYRLRARTHGRNRLLTTGNRRS